MNFLETLEQYKVDGLLYNQVHPDLPLTIWNYTQRVQYEGLWDEITLQCRGLVTDDKGNVAARPFKKFFNIEENNHVATDDFEIFEKLDGSLIIVFWYNDQRIVASRGSFTSDHVKWAIEILEAIPHFDLIVSIYTDCTMCFELIHPDNRIVVDYGDNKSLILTGLFQTDTGKECDMDHDLREWISVVEKFKGLDYKNIKQLNWRNSEGFVVRFSNGDRCKIKFEDYIRLHRLMTNISEKRIWEALKDDVPITLILQDVPDEFFQEVKAIEDKFIESYNLIQKDVTDRYFIELAFYTDRKSLSESIKDYQYKQILFAIFDNKEYSKLIWKMLKP